MKTTSTERQRKYREKNLKAVGCPDVQLNMVINHETWMMLKRMSSYLGFTQRELLARLVLEEDRKVQQDK
jgi:hypothetical protein